jgi:ribonuclease P protein component
VLPRRHRLVDSSGFKEAVRRGKRAGSKSLVVHLLVPGTGPAADREGEPQVGFVVSKAVGPAVVRNRVKRRLRHQARESLSGLPGSAVLVVRALPAAADADYDALGADLRRCLERVLR